MLITRQPAAKSTSVDNALFLAAGLRPWSGPEHPVYRYLLARQESPHLTALTLGLLHKFNNIYTGVTFLMAECLTREEAGESVADRLREIQATLHEAHQCIDRIAQLHAEETDDEAGYHELDALIASHLDLAKLLLPRGTALQHIPASERLAFYANPRVLAHILLHALGNCGEALPKRGGSVTIRSRLHGGEGAFVAIEIRDNGPGFSPETLDRLFTPFCTTKDESQHVGLGLLYSRELARKFGGDLIAGNHLDGGAVVTLILPRDNPQSSA